MNAQETGSTEIGELVAVIADLGQADTDAAGRILSRVADLVERAGDRREVLALGAGEHAAHGPLAALRTAAVAGLELGDLEPASGMAIEIAAAVLSAPWFTTDSDRVRAAAAGLRAAAWLAPEVLGDVGRDIGSWGCLAAALGCAVARGFTPDEQEEVVALAASLTLAPVAQTASAAVHYSVLRAGHAAASAILAVEMAEVGVVGDRAALTTLVERLAVEAPNGRVAEAFGHRMLHALGVSAQ